MLETQAFIHNMIPQLNELKRIGLTQEERVEIFKRDWLISEREAQDIVDTWAEIN